MRKILDLNERDSFGNRDVPWHSEYVKEKSNVGNESLVEKIIVCTTGLLIIAEDFKDYVYKGKRSYDLLIEALEHYVEKPADSIPFVVQATNKKSAELGILEDYEGSGVWMKDNKSYFFDTPKETPSIDPSLNPFMPPTHLSNGKRRKSGTTRA